MADGKPRESKPGPEKGKKRRRRRTKRVPKAVARLAELVGEKGPQYAPKVRLEHDGAMLWVGGVGFAVGAVELRGLAREAHAVSSALLGEGDPVLDENVVSPFMPAWPGRLPVESGIPGELLDDSVLTARHRLLWVMLWRDGCSILPRPPQITHAQSRVYSHRLGCGQPAVMRDFRLLHDHGWITLGPSHSPYVRHAYHIEVHVRRARPAPEVGPRPHYVVPSHAKRRPWIIKLLREHGRMPVTEVQQWVNTEHGTFLSARAIRNSLDQLVGANIAEFELVPSPPGSRSRPMKWYWLRPDALGQLRRDGTVKPGAVFVAKGDPVAGDFIDTTAESPESPG